MLKLVAEGLPSKEVAPILGVTPQAVEFHIRNLLSKFDCQNRTSLVAKAFVYGFLDPQAWPPKLTLR